MNKASFDQSSQNLVLKEIQIADMSLIHLTIGTAAEKNQQNDTFSTLFLVETTLHENNWITKQHNSSTGI